MTTLVHAALTVRRSARASFGFIAFLAFAAIVVLGGFSVPFHELAIEHAFVASAWVAVVSMRLHARSRGSDETQKAALHDLELGLLLLAGAHALVQLGGGVTGPIYPIVYVVIAFVSAFSRRGMGSLVVLAALAFEAVLWFVTEQRGGAAGAFATHALFIVFFGLLHLLFTRAEIARVRERNKRELDEERAKVKEDARLFRLVGAIASESVRDEDRLFRSSVDEVKQSLFYTIDLLKRTLGLHTCVLLMLDERQELRIVELATDSDDVAEGPFPSGEGALGAVVRRAAPTRLEALKPGYKGICYYRGPSPVRAFLGVPVLDRGQLRGVLCADRIEKDAFTGAEEQLLGAAIAQVLRALENERVFVQLERSKREQSILHRASQMLGAALTESAVIEGGLSAAAEIAPYDFAAVTCYDRQTRKHSVIRAVGDGAEGLSRLTFRDNTSLTAMAVHNRHYLPYRGEFDASQQVVYTRRTNLRGMESLLILPLLVREDAIGTLALAAHKKDAFGEAVRPALQVLANQLAVALANAASVRRLEELATTDGLTGCLNKRAFLEELEKRLRSADRFGRKLSLIVTDIDHFKSVNDTYGHATGDVVIRGLGEVLRRVKRETDVVARFGGEEFCVLCEETDTEGAKLLAERVRTELAASVYPCDLGKVQVTASLGVATFPQSGKDGSALFEAADRALYAAKHGGRNRVCAG